MDSSTNTIFSILGSAAIQVIDQYNDPLAIECSTNPFQLIVGSRESVIERDRSFSSLIPSLLDIRDLSFGPLIARIGVP
jgi:hypothetical protein